MSDNRFFWPFTFCIFIWAAVGTYAQHQRNLIIDDCEAKLPRDQICVLIAVPEVMDTSKRGE